MIFSRSKQGIIPVPIPKVERIPDATPKTFLQGFLQGLSQGSFPLKKKQCKKCG
jgi:hypothetical protein